jgi:uncharacterized protein
VLFQNAIYLVRNRPGKVSGFLIFLRVQLSKLFAAHGYNSLLFIGLLNGLLPCGLVYMALAGAVGTGSIPMAVLFMILFGLGTAPVMMAIPYAAKFISMGARNHMRKAVPVIVTCMALLLILRGLNLGIPYISPKVQGEQPETVCCHHGSENNLNDQTCTGQNYQPNK